MQATGFRIGNLVNYKIIDDLDPRKEWYEVTEIDIDDLRVLQVKDEMNQDYQYIPLTEELFVNLGFLIYSRYNDKGVVTVHKSNYNGIKYTIFGVEIKYVHELQNWYHLLTGQELTLSN